jgi:hypothetical protein
MDSYNLPYIRGEAFTGESYADVLQQVADFAKSNEGAVVLSVALGYSEDDITAVVSYE